MAAADTDGPATGMRTCVGCRSKAHRSDLVRLVVDRQAAVPTVVVDARAVMPGRGVWLHQRSECLDRAESRRAIARGLRLTQAVPLEEVRAWFDRHAASLIIDQESGLVADGHPMSTQR